ncbi:MAG TPA: 2-oxoacid:acceptor oxidoreductase family protein, partial [Armatimonadota bacterium]|nr:2-oxoacid:acceptor oxidoreductase family protein [Armatimonadota bacterium]
VVRPGGVVLYNSSLVPPPATRDGAVAIGIPASAIAEEAGNPKAANMVLLGALCACWDTIAVDVLKAALRAESVGRWAQFLDANLMVIDAGADAVRRAGGRAPAGSAA